MTQAHKMLEVTGTHVPRRAIAIFHFLQSSIQMSVKASGFKANLVEKYAM